MSASHPGMAEAASATIAGLPSEIRIPIARTLDFVSAAFSFLKLTFSFFTGLFTPFLRLSPLPVLGYVCAPLFVFLDITTTLFVRAPYRTVAYLLEAVFPLYVFVGVACITGVLLGLIARVMCRLLTASLEPAEFDGFEPAIVKTEADLGSKDTNRKRKGKQAEKTKLEA
jgi:hypothetical protein